MDTMLFEIVVIFFLIILNGFFSCSEFAIVSIRKSQVAKLVAEGDERAIIIEDLQHDPHRVLALVQIGVTVAGSAASTVGGFIAVEHLRPFFMTLPWSVIRQSAEPLSVVIMVTVISYVSLVIGELVPKTIGLQYAEPIALRVARLFDMLSRFGSFAISVLTVSSKAVMRLIRVDDNKSGFITREEVQHIVAEGHESGVFSETENEYIRNVFEFTHTCVREVMVPRMRIVGIDINASRDEVIRIVLENMYSRYPVYRGDIEEIAGVVHGKDLMGRLIAGAEFDLSAIMKLPVFVPESKKVNDLMKEMQRTHNQMAMVVDEYGGLSGIVTSEDLIEELLGEIRDEHDQSEMAPIMEMSDGSYLVDGIVSVFDLGDLMGFKADDDVPYDSVAGLVLHELGRFPQRGEMISWHGYCFTCEEVTRTSIQRIRVTNTKVC